MREETNINGAGENEGRSLDGLSKKMPFSTPENYFQNFTIEIGKAIEIDNFEKNYKNIKNPLQVPEGYFDQFPEQLLSQIKGNDNKASKKVKLHAISIKNWALAASLVLMVAVSVVIYRNQTMRTPSQILSSVNDPDISEYVDNNYGIETKNMLDKETLIDGNFERKEIIQYLNETGWE